MGNKSQAARILGISRGTVWNQDCESIILTLKRSYFPEKRHILIPDLKGDFVEGLNSFLQQAFVRHR